MQVKLVTEIDVKMIGQLMQAISIGKFDVTGQDIGKLAQTFSWLGGLARDMAADLRTGPAPASESDGPTAVKPNPVGPIKTGAAPKASKVSK